MASIGLVYTALLAGENWPLKIFGQGGAAHACCYDPPAAVIVPDPPAEPVPAAPEAETQTSAATQTLDSQSEAATEKDDIPPVNLYDAPVRAARNAIAQGEWLRARVIVLDAEQVFGAEPILTELRAEIDAYFGLANLRSPAIAAPVNRRLPPVQTVTAGADPLANMLADFGAVATELVAE